MSTTTSTPTPTWSYQEPAAVSEDERDTAARLVRAFQAIGPIGKDKQADMGGGGKFMFRGIDALLDALHRVLGEQGLVLEVETLPGPSKVERERWEQRFKDGGSRMVATTHAVLWVSVWAVGPTGGRVKIGTGVGEALDNGDKAVSKATTVAYRDLLFKAFVVPLTGSGIVDIESLDAASEFPAGPEAAPWSDEQAADIAAKLVTIRSSSNADEALDDFGGWMKEELPAVSVAAKPGTKRHPTDTEADDIIAKLDDLVESLEALASEPEG